MVPNLPGKRHKEPYPNITDCVACLCWYVLQVFNAPDSIEQLITKYFMI